MGRHFFRMLTLCQCVSGNSRHSDRTLANVEIATRRVLASERCGSRFSCAGRAAAGARGQRDVHAAVDSSGAAGGRRERGLSGAAGVGRRGLEVAERLRAGAGARDTARLDPNLPLALRMGRKHLDDALGVIDRYLEKEPRSSRRPDFENRAPQIAALGVAADGCRGELGTAAAAVDPKARAGVREPLRDADAQPEPDAAAAAGRERPDRAAAVRRRGDGAVDGDRAGRGGAGGRGRGAAVHAADVAAAVGVACPRAAAGRAATMRSERASRRATRSAIWRASSMRWPDAIQEREQRLIRSERLATVGRMAAHIAHEVRNPLASIGLNAELLGDEMVDRGEEARRLVDVDHRRGRPADRDHRDLPALRAAAAAEAGTREPGRHRRRRSWRCRAASWPRRGIGITVDVAPGLPDVAADEAQLRQALINLMRNAREAMSDGGARRHRRLGARAARDGSRSPFTIRVRASARRTSGRSSIRSSRPRSAAPGSGWRWCSRSWSTTAAGSRSRAPRAQGPTFTLTLPVGDAERPKSARRRRWPAPAARWAAARLRSPSVSYRAASSRCSRAGDCGPKRRARSRAAAPAAVLPVAARARPSAACRSGVRRDR